METISNKVYLKSLFILLIGILVSCQNMDEKTGFLTDDIMGIAPSRLQSDSSGGSETSIKKFQWPKNTVPYKFEKNYPNHLKKMFHQAIKHISTQTCIRFVPRTNQKDYINVISSDTGCWSFVGRMGGSQNVSLPEKCQVLGTFIHELLHVIGLVHEQSRRDRKKYVDINWANILKGHEHNFEVEKINWKAPYDYNSVMHYSRTAFTRNGEDTIIPKKKKVEIGQRKGLSMGDVMEVNEMYCGKGKGQGQKAGTLKKKMTNKVKKDFVSWGDLRKSRTLYNDQFYI